jgi:hypothetical protein
MTPSLLRDKIYLDIVNLSSTTAKQILSDRRQFAGKKLEQVFTAANILIKKLSNFDDSVDIEILKHYQHYVTQIFKAI